MFAFVLEARTWILHCSQFDSFGTSEKLMWDQKQSAHKSFFVPFLALLFLPGKNDYVWMNFQGICWLRRKTVVVLLKGQYDACFAYQLEGFKGRASWCICYIAAASGRHQSIAHQTRFDMKHFPTTPRQLQRMLENKLFIERCSFSKDKKDNCFESCAVRSYYIWIGYRIRLKKMLFQCAKISPEKEENFQSQRGQIKRCQHKLYLSGSLSSLRF